MIADKLSPMGAIAAFTFLEALRNRLFWLVLAIVVAGLGLAEFVGEIAITESAQVRGALLGAALRLAAVVLTSLFVVTSMVREFNDKGLELVLSLPLPRASYFLGKLMGFILLSATCAALFAACLLFYAPPQQVAIWGLSLAMELTLVTAFGLLCLFTFNQVTLALSAVLGFYVLARAIGAVQLIGQGPLAPVDSFSQDVLNLVVDGIAFLLPTLYRFTDTEWLVYHTGDWGTLLPLAGQTAVYLVLLAGAALFDLYRRPL